MIYIFLANGFEEIEALCPLDLLRRAELETVTVGIGGKYITGAHGITVAADITDADFNPTLAPDMIILPGGMPGTSNLDASDKVQSAIEYAAANDSYIAAICAAPMILGKKELLVGRRATCFPGFEKYLTGADVRADAGVVRDGKLITAAGMGVALDFGLELVSALRGEEYAKELRRAVIADRKA